MLRADPRLMAAARARAASETPPDSFSTLGDRPRPAADAANPLDRSSELAALHSALPLSVPGVAPPAAAAPDATESAGSEGAAAATTRTSARVGPRAAAVLAEMELAFVLFMLISSWAAFEQWKKFVLLLCSCDSALCDPQCATPQPLPASTLPDAALAHNRYVTVTYRCATVI